MPKLVAALATAIFAAIVLAACGSGSSTTGASTSSETTSQSDGVGSKAQGGGSVAEDQGDESRQSKSADSSSSSSGSGVKAAPLHVSGGGSAQYRTHSGDNSVQGYGEESDESELKEAAEVLHSFLVARVNGDWPAACTYIAKSMVQQLEQLASRSQQLKGKGCAAILGALTAAVPSAERRESTEVDAGSLRHEGERAFLIYYGAGKSVFTIPMTQEAGSWKVTSLAPTPLS